MTVHRSSSGADGERPLTPVLAMLASALAFSLMGVCVKQVGGRIPAAEVVLARAIVSVGLSWWLLQHAGVNPWGQRRGLLILRGAIGTVALLCVYAALALLPLASATVLQYLYPTITALLAWLMLGEPIGRRVLLAMLLGWIGVLLVAQPAGLLQGATALPPLAVLIAIGGALFTALAYVSVRSLGSSEHPLVIVFYFPLVALPMTLPLVALDPVLPTPMELLWLVGVGVFTQLGQVALTRGLTALPAAQATAISYVQVVFAGLWGWLVFGEGLDGWTVAGAALVLAATLVSLRPRPAAAAGQ
ncbi:DMT family transporter [Vulcanococcus limneticus]|uniref:DMT family transporter n=1 Tax=Vulcanococcus limneticus TaxID=2170428 RepID=UPI00398C1F55